MLHCNLAKTPPIPLFSHLYRFHGKSPRVCSSIKGKDFLLDFSSFGMGGRVLYSTRAKKVAFGNSVASKVLATSTRSSWEQSAEKFFSKHEGKPTKTEERGDKIVTRKEKYNRVAERNPRVERPGIGQWTRHPNWGKKTEKEHAQSTVPDLVGQGVYGVGPVLAALMAGRREFHALYVQEGMDLSGSNKKKKDKKGVEKVLQTAENVGLKVVEKSKHDLNMIVDNRPHQGLVLDASPLEMVSIKELEPVAINGSKAPVWVALDEVMDPQNLGAIIRSAYFFGAKGVVLCAKNSAPLSGVVSKASAGSLELIELRSCKNMMQFLSLSAENGWRVLGGSVSAKAVPVTEVCVGEPTILVLGSEGTGLRALVERSCTHLVRINGNIDGFLEGTEADAEEEEESRSGNRDIKSFLAVESLNVSVAAGVLLYHLAGSNSDPVSDKPSSSLYEDI